MKYLNLLKDLLFGLPTETTLTKEQIRFLNYVCVGDSKFVLDSKGRVNVYGGVDIAGVYVEKLPLKFGKVYGGFRCHSNTLTTFEGFPIFIKCGLDLDLNFDNFIPYFKNNKEEDFSHWDKLDYWDWYGILQSCPFLVNIGKKFLNKRELKYYLNEFPQTKLYLD